jgi:hypothetical protein
MRTHRIRQLAPALLALLALPFTLSANELTALRQQLRELEQKILILERKQELEVAPGRHRVELAYRPLSFRIGLVVSFLSAVALALPVLRQRLQRR